MGDGRPNPDELRDEGIAPEGAMSSVTSATRMSNAPSPGPGSASMMPAASQTTRAARARIGPQETPAERQAGVWRAVGNYLAGVAEHGASHPEATRMLDVAYREVVRALRADENGVRWSVDPTGFKMGGEPVWTPTTAPADRIPFRLYADGLRQLRIARGVTLDELRDFLQIIAKDNRHASLDEDDSVTALWERRLPHVAYGIVDNFGEGAPPAFMAQCADVAMKAAKASGVEADWEALRVQAATLRIDLVSSLRESAASAVELANDAQIRSTLAEGLVLPESDWLARFVDVFGAALAEGKSGAGTGPGSDDSKLLAALASWTADRFLQKDCAATFALCDALVADLNSDPSDTTRAPLAGDVWASMYSRHTLAPVLHVLAREGRGAKTTGDDRTRDPRLQNVAFTDGLNKAFRRVRSDGLVTEALDAFDGLEDETVREAVLKYVKLHAKNRAPDLKAMLATAHVDTGCAIVRVLAESDCSDEMLDGALTSPHVRVRLDALRRTPPTQAERANRELDMMLQDPTSHVRMDVLRGIGQLGLKSLGPAIVAKIKDASFHKLPSSERRRWMETVVQLNASRGEALVIETLKNKPLISSDDVEETRALAALVLGTLTTKESLAAVDDAAKARFGSQAVRDAAQAAAKAIRGRVSGGAP